MKNIKITLVALSVLLLFTACSGQTQSNVSDANNVLSQTVSQSPDRTAEIYGQVKTILGNEVTLSLAEAQNNTELSEAEKENRQQEMQALSPEDKQKLRDGQVKFTGETITIIIPVGTPITSGNSNNGQQNLTELALADISESLFLRIWLEEGGDGETKTAEYVRVLQSQQ